MRVAEVHRETVLLHDNDVERGGRAWSRLLRANWLMPALASAVGDWVLAARDEHGGWWGDDACRR